MTGGTGRRDGTFEGSLEETVQLVEGQGGRHTAMPSTADPSLDRAALVEQIEADFDMDGDVLVINATGSGSTRSHPTGAWR